MKLHDIIPFLALVAGPVLASPAVADPDISVESSVRIAHDDFYRSLIAGNYESYREQIWQLPSVSDVFGFHQEDRNRDMKSGVVLLRQNISKVELYQANAGYFAVLHVARVYEHPINPDIPVSVDGVVYAKYDVDDRGWMFNVIGCFPESRLREELVTNGNKVVAAPTRS